MSLNYVPVEKTIQYDPRTKFIERIFAITKGGRDQNWKNYNASSVSTTSVNIICNPPNRQTIIDKKVYLRLTFPLTFAGTGTGNLLQVGVNDAPRAFPLSQVANTIEVQIGGETVTVNLSDYISALVWYDNSSDQKHIDFSGTPSMLDQYQQYSDWALYGSGKNALANYGETGPSEDGRGGFAGLEILTNTNTTATANLTITEPVFVSPLAFGKGEGPGLRGVDQMQITVNLGQNLSRLWSHSSLGNNITSVTVGTPTQAVALLHFIAPSLVQTIPNSLTYPFVNVQRYPTDGPSLAPGASATINANQIQLKGIPQLIYVYARENNNSLTYSSTDTFAAITSLSLDFDTRNGIFAGCSQNDLYNLSVKNGLKMSYPQFSTYCGSIFCAEFGTDIPLDEKSAPGMGGSYDLNIDVNITNMNDVRTINYQLYIVVCYPGSFSIINGNVTRQLQVVTAEDALKAYGLPETPYMHDHNFYGGNFWDSVGSFFKSIPGAVAKGVKKTGEFLKEARPYAETALKIAPLLGLGYNGGAPVGGYASERCPKGSRKKCVASRAKTPGKRKGKGFEEMENYSGGKMMSRKELKKNADQIEMDTESEEE